MAARSVRKWAGSRGRPAGVNGGRGGGRGGTPGSRQVSVHLILRDPHRPADHHSPPGDSHRSPLLPVPGRLYPHRTL